MRSKIKKVFGIISYFPDNDNVFHKEARKARMKRCSELLYTLEKLWPDIDIMIVAQNWQDYSQPNIKNTIIRYNYDKLGILGARRILREKFLDSNYDYLIMLDDDAIISTDNSQAYMDEIDSHPDGVGVIRTTHCPLTLCAISKAIYSNIDIPDVDAENGEGFEDDLFVAMCFNKFPDKAYKFPDNIINETSFSYRGPGECPSTWAKERQYDWEYMRNVTQARIRSLRSPKEYTTEDLEPCIDAVIPYVTSSDELWLKDFVDITGIHNYTGVRFRSWNTLKYLIRGISECMPFVKRVILILARESQLPEWVNQETVRVVYHREFIPEKLLPTFNSCTIESFLYRIPDISDRFIYFNDDMFPVGLMGLSDFFDGNIPKIHFNMNIHLERNNIYKRQCRSGMDMIADALGVERYQEGRIFKPEHSLTPMLKSTLDRVGELCGDKLPNTATILRKKQNINQYIYSYYQYFTGNYIQSMHRFMYIEMKNNPAYFRSAMLGNDFQVICINDSADIKDYEKTQKELITIFEEKFPNKSQFEI